MPRGWPRDESIKAMAQKMARERGCKPSDLLENDIIARIVEVVRFRDEVAAWFLRRGVDSRIVKDWMFYQMLKELEEEKKE